MARRASPLLSWGTALQRSFGDTLQRSFTALARAQVRTGSRVARQAVKSALQPVRSRAAHGKGDWIAGVAMASGGVRRFRLYRPPGVGFSERLPLVVMLHGCQQDAEAFAASTRMNALAARERFFVLYPEQDRLANAQGCWNWYETRSGQAQGEVGILMSAVRQVCLLYAVDTERVAVVGLSAGASMAALLATRHPDRFKAVAMHSGVPPGTANSTASALAAMRGRRIPAAAAAQDTPWPPLMVIHGDADRLVSARNAAASVALWAAASGAQPTAPRHVQRGKRHAMTVTDYKHRGATVASLCEVGSLGHAWSGGAARSAFSDAAGPDASRLVWGFVSRQFARVA